MLITRNVFSPTCFANTAISSLKDSDEQTSPPATPGSLGVQVANSHFSKISASRGNRGCLHGIKHNSKCHRREQGRGQHWFYKLVSTTRHSSGNWWYVYAVLCMAFIAYSCRKIFRRYSFYWQIIMSNDLNKMYFFCAALYFLLSLQAWSAFVFENIKRLICAICSILVSYVNSRIWPFWKC